MNNRTGKLMIAATLLLLGVGSASWVGCTKSDLDQPGRAGNLDGKDPGGPKLPYYMFAVSGGYTTPVSFHGWKGCDGCYGDCYNGTAIWVGISSQNATTLFVKGQTSPFGVQTNANDCEFTKGPDKFTGGPVYYIVPNQGPTGGTKKCIRLQVKGLAVINTTGQYFNYNVTTNSWTVQSGASAGFIWTFVNESSLPANCC